jgi:hypothetical protein
MLPAGEAYVVFGGGSPSEELQATPGATFAAANPADSAFSFGLNLDDDGDVVRLLDPERREVARFVYGDACPDDDDDCPAAVSDQSLTRSPDVDGDWTPHTEAEEDTVLSPGTHADGSFFGGDR